MFLDHELLTVYKSIGADPVVRSVCAALSDENEDAPGELTSAVSGLIEHCEKHGLHGNLWAAYLTDLLLNDENVYSENCEMRGSVSGSVKDPVLHDAYILCKLFKADLRGLIRTRGLSWFECIFDYSCSGESCMYGARTIERICGLAERLTEAADAAELLEILSGHYGRFGMGTLGLHRAFQIDTDRDGHVVIEPVHNMIHVTLDELVGYETAKDKLRENTEAFIDGRPANNCLLYGDAGTGKSTCIRALATEYYDRGLRIIQVHRNQFELLSDLIAQIKNRHYRFIIYMDDLSFEDFETDYKYLKAVIEGGLEQRPGNIVIYATSNRRHLIKETVSDRADRDEDMHRSDTMSEKLSLSQRFGVSIYFGSPSKKEFDHIVLSLAERYGISMPDEELLAEANKWELSHSGRSGRTARQFIDHLLGTLPERSSI